MTSRTVTLGADSWAVLVAELEGVVLPSPFRAIDTPLDPEVEVQAREALDASELVPGESGELLADLHPSIATTFGIAAAPSATVGVTVGLGDDHVCAWFALSDALAAGMRRSVDPSGDEAELGPVDLTAMLPGDVPDAVTGLLGETPEHPAGQATLELDATSAVAVVRLLEQGHADTAAALVDGPVPPPLPEAVRDLRCVARVDVTGGSGRQTLLLLRVADGWWLGERDEGDDIALVPVDRDDISVLVGQLVDHALTTEVIG